jgi:hypothetical protein
VAWLKDPPELLDVNVDQLARLAALVAVRWLGRLEPGSLAQADAPEHRGDRRQRHPERDGDASGGHS